MSGALVCRTFAIALLAYSHQPVSKSKLPLASDPTHSLTLPIPLLHISLPLAFVLQVRTNCQYTHEVFSSAKWQIKVDLK